VNVQLLFIWSPREAVQKYAYFDGSEEVVHFPVYYCRVIHMFFQPRYL